MLEPETKTKTTPKMCVYKIHNYCYEERYYRILGAVTAAVVAITRIHC